MYFKLLYKILNYVNIRDYCCCGPVRHFRKKINMNVKEMKVNSTLNQQKEEGKQL